MSKSDLHIRLPEELGQALAAEAKKLGISLNAMVGIALREWLAQKEKQS